MRKLTVRAASRWMVVALCGSLAAAPAWAGNEDDAAPQRAPSQQLAAAGSPSPAGESLQTNPWSLHGQFTNVTQYHPAFRSPYQGANSLAGANATNETADLTAIVGRRLWSGAALYVDPEIDQGFGLSDTLGVAGFPSGEAYKLGYLHPYFRLPRAFLRQVIATDGQDSSTDIPDGANQLAGRQPDGNLTITAGKFSVVDVFDSNRYAHDPRADFLNWSIIESGAFDYPADAWGFTYGLAVEWTRKGWTLRGGFFALSKVPNTRDLDGQFKQFGWVAEFEERHEIGGHAGKVKVLGFDNRGRMGGYDAAVALGRQTDAAPSTAPVRRFASRPGAAINVEQELAPDLGAFARLSANDGSKEAFDFTEINKSLAGGISLQGGRWGRNDDTAGAAYVVNGLSSAARAYFADGGIGILIGDGHLTYGFERILETFYSFRLREGVTLSGDYQRVANPAYNRDRGPVSILGIRIHAER
jgi:high affinity Mn2+ porin